MKTCDCKPGTEANGWYEIRCAACLEIERKVWRKAFDAFPKVLEELRRRKRNG